MELKPGYKKTKVGIIPREWSAIQLGELSDFVTSGSRGWAKYYSDNGAIFIRSQNIRDGHLDLTDRQCVTPPSGAEGDRTRLVAGDLMVTITGNNVGNVAWLKKDVGEAYISQHVGLVRLLDPSYSEYVCRYLAPGSPGNAQIFAGQAGQSKPGLNLKNLEDFWVAIPPTKVEQEAIAEALSDADTLIQTLDQLIAKKRQIKQGAMQELLAGKRRLPGFGGEWSTITMRDVLTMPATYGIVTAGAFIQNGVKMLRGGDIFDGSINNELPMVSLEKSAEYTRTVLTKNDVVIALVGYPGASAKIPDELIGSNISRAVGLLRLNDRVSPDYLVCMLNSPDGRRMVLAPSAGSAQQVVNLAALNKLQFSIPVREEQEAIASIFNEMDTELAVLESRLTKARQIKQGMMQELLTGRIRLI